MKIKLDENLGARCLELLREAGHDAATVGEEHLSGASDAALIETCRTETRCLITLDLDFGNPLRFKPSAFHGIVVLRLPAKPAHEDLVERVMTVIAALARETVEGRLWVVQHRRIRVYQEDLPEPDE